MVHRFCGVVVGVASTRPQLAGDGALLWIFRVKKAFGLSGVGPRIFRLFGVGPRLIVSFACLASDRFICLELENWREDEQLQMTRKPSVLDGPSSIADRRHRS